MDGHEQTAKEQSVDEVMRIQSATLTFGNFVVGRVRGWQLWECVRVPWSAEHRQA